MVACEFRSCFKRWPRLLCNNSHVECCVSTHFGLEAQAATEQTRRKPHQIIYCDHQTSVLDEGTLSVLVIGCVVHLWVDGARSYGNVDNEHDSCVLRIACLCFDMLSSTSYSTRGLNVLRSARKVWVISPQRHEIRRRAWATRASAPRDTSTRMTHLMTGRECLALFPCRFGLEEIVLLLILLCKPPLWFGFDA